MARAGALYVLSIFQICASIFSAVAANNSHHYYARFEAASVGQKLDHAFGSVDTESLVSCCASCSTEDLCVAVSYTPETGKCELSEKNPLDYPDFGLVPIETGGTRVYSRIGETCEPGWSQFDRHCYFFANETGTWELGNLTCNSMGAELVSINTETEDTFVVQKSEEAGQLPSNYLWLGLADYHKQYPTRYWVDGQPLVYENFFTGEPNNVDGIENCLAYAYYVGEYGWIDEPCDYDRHSFACEKVLY